LSYLCQLVCMQLNMTFGWQLRLNGNMLVLFNKAFGCVVYYMNFK